VTPRGLIWQRWQAPGMPSLNWLGAVDGVSGVRSQATCSVFRRVAPNRCWPSRSTETAESALRVVAAQLLEAARPDVAVQPRRGGRTQLGRQIIRDIVTGPSRRDCCLPCSAHGSRGRSFENGQAVDGVKCVADPWLWLPWIGFRRRAYGTRADPGRGCHSGAQPACRAGDCWSVCGAPSQCLASVSFREPHWAWPIVRPRHLHSR
jgi:hypothetical protein